MAIVQGSFERIAGMSLSSSVPEAFVVAAEQWASEGCYVLAMSHRSDPQLLLSTWFTYCTVHE